MEWLRRWFDGWTRKAQLGTADLMVRRCCLTLLDCHEDDVAAVFRLVWRIRLEGDPSQRRVLALLLLRDELEDVLKRGEQYRRGA